MIKVSMVPPDQVVNCWSKVEKYLEGAAKYTYGRYEAGDILDCLTDYDHTLWVAFDETEVKGAVVTNITPYPRKKYVSLAFCGGIELDEWKDDMLKLLQCWAYDNGCAGLESTGRPGWSKIFKDDGHKFLWHTYELPAGDAGIGEKHG